MSVSRYRFLRAVLLGGSAALTIAPAFAEEPLSFNIAQGDLKAALDCYTRQTGVQLIYPADRIAGIHTQGVHGKMIADVALDRLLKGTNFAEQVDSSGAIAIVDRPRPVQLAQAAPRPAPQASIETVVVTAQHKSEDIQTVPISITALSQQQLTDRQIAGGPDLLKSVPNMDFTKTNFSGYDIELRGIGTQAISVTTDPAVAVAFNDIPFIRNHFFEQEFFDLQDVEVLLGPQGTLYGRNATAGVVNLKSALPTDQFEAMASADVGNYMSQRYEGMINLPISGDQLDIRIAGEWTKRNGYTLDSTLNTDVDGRDLWSGRMTIGWKPSSDLQTYLIWEHFSEDDDRLRSGKQLCKTSPIPTTVDGVNVGSINVGYGYAPGDYLTQGCEMTSLYSPSAFEVPNGFSLPYYSPFSSLDVPVNAGLDPYASTTQSTNLRVIESAILPTYKAKNDTVEFNATYKISDALTLTSQTGYNNDFLWSTEDYNRFDSAPGAFTYGVERYQPIGITLPDPAAGTNGIPNSSGVFCDPQLGCSDKLIAEDLDEEHAWQASQEFRLTSNFSGPLNFSAGANYLHYETVEDYYVFINTVTLAAVSQANPYAATWNPGSTTNQQCLKGYGGYAYQTPAVVTGDQLNCVYIDPNPIGSLNNQGHNYFLSQNPYTLNSYALFGEAYYNIAPDLKLTTGVRWTDDQKHFTDIPSELLVTGYGYPSTGIVNQQWDQWTGREVVDWTPNLSFTDQSLFYASYSHGYKAGGANPPGAVFTTGYDAQVTQIANPIHPLTFKPEFIEAFELGTKNTLLDGSLTLDGDVFYYNYTGYQISEIVDRSAINNNYNAHVEGAEVTANWEPVPGFKFNFAGGWEDTAAAGGTEGVDLMDRTAGNPYWMVVKPFPTQASNCIIPAYVVLFQLQNNGGSLSQDCAYAYSEDKDPVTGASYVSNPTSWYDGTPIAPGSYAGFNPAMAPNNGEGIDKDLTHHALPNAPPLTASLGGQYSIPVTQDWAATLRADFYWQADSWARIFNDNPYDRLDGYTNLNLALILASDDGWQVMGYVKNVFNVTAITGDFLNSDDSGLTTNVFLTDPRLYGVRVTKDFGEGDTGAMRDVENYITNLFADGDNGKPALWIELGGDYAMLQDNQQTFAPPFFSKFASPLAAPTAFEHVPDGSFDYDAELTYQPDGTDWTFSAAVRYGRTARADHTHQQSHGMLNIPATDHAGNIRYLDAFNSSDDKHAIFDFAVGKDVGLGLLGLPGSSHVSGGLRFVQFNQSSGFSIHADPDYTFNRDGPKYHHNYSASSQTKRSFEGVGPSLSWDASTPVADSTQADGISFDWGANGAVLFGRQVAQVHHQTSGAYQCSPIINGGCRMGVLVGSGLTREYKSAYQHSGPAQPRRSRMVTVPDIGGFVGLSWRYSNAKVSFGYRADEFFGAMDGGIDTRKSENVGFFGPYANISIGLGG